MNHYCKLAARRLRALADEIDLDSTKDSNDAKKEQGSNNNGLIDDLSLEIDKSDISMRDLNYILIVFDVISNSPEMQLSLSEPEKVLAKIFECLIKKLQKSNAFDDFIRMEKIMRSLMRISTFEAAKRENIMKSLLLNGDSSIIKPVLSGIINLAESPNAAPLLSALDEQNVMNTIFARSDISSIAKDVCDLLLSRRGRPSDSNTNEKLVLTYYFLFNIVSNKTLIETVGEERIIYHILDLCEKKEEYQQILDYIASNGFESNFSQKNKDTLIQAEDIRQRQIDEIEMRRHEELERQRKQYQRQIDEIEMRRHEELERQRKQNNHFSQRQTIGW